MASPRIVTGFTVGLVSPSVSRGSWQRVGFPRESPKPALQQKQAQGPLKLEARPEEQGRVISRVLEQNTRAVPVVNEGLAFQGRLQPVTLSPPRLWFPPSAAAASRTAAARRDSKPAERWLGRRAQAYGPWFMNLPSPVVWPLVLLGKSSFHTRTREGVAAVSLCRGPAVQTRRTPDSGWSSWCARDSAEASGTFRP